MSGFLGHVFFLGYWPLTWYIARTVKPTGILVWTLAYYYGAYKGIAQPLALKSFQSGLNSAAHEYREKYAVKGRIEYLE